MIERTSPPLARLRHHVSGAIARGEKQPIAGIPANDGKLRAFTMPNTGPRVVIVDEDGHGHAFRTIHDVIVPACYLNGRQP